jgi:hypothetical protein
VAGRPLRSAADRRFGGPLPHQLANQTRGHLSPINLFTPGHAALCAYAVLAAVSSCCPPEKGRFPTRYSPVRHWIRPEGRLPFDLHVLGTPPALILSQDRTLMLRFRPGTEPSPLLASGSFPLLTVTSSDVWDYSLESRIAAGK